MNETIRALLERRSIRKFTSQALTEDQITTLTDVALSSASAVNRQPWIFRFVTRQPLLKALSDRAIRYFEETGDLDTLARIRSRHPSIFYGAPLLILIGLPQADGSQLEAGIAVANLATAAQAMGLGSCIIGMTQAALTGDEKDAFEKELDWPSGFAFAISLAVGYPAMGKEAPQRQQEKARRID